MEQTSFWDRIAARTRPTGASAAVENSMTLVWIGTGVMWTAFVSAAFTALAFFWFDEPAAAWASVAVAICYAAAWILFASTGSIFGMGVIAVIASALDILFVHFVLGGFANSGAYLAWGVINVVGAALVFPRRAVIGVAVYFAGTVVLLGPLESTLRASREAPDPALSTLLFVLVIGMNILLTGMIVITVLDRLRRERERAEGLLLNVLPAELAAELKETGSTTPRHYDGISVLYADIVGFTPQSAGMDPDELINSLNAVFSAFDALARKHGAERIRTIGDNYLVAAGVPAPRDDHAEVLATLGLEMLDYAETSPWSFRIGIDSGPAVAGVIGTEKFQYDLYGDTVTTASRMESEGAADRIQISDATYQLISDTYATTRRGPIAVKGKGTLTTHWLESPIEVP